MQPARQTAERKGAQTRPSTFCFQTPASLNLKGHIQSAAEAPVYNFHTAAHKV